MVTLERENHSRLPAFTTSVSTKNAQLLKGRQDGGCPGIRGLFGRAKVMSNLAILSNQRKTFRAQQHRSRQFQTECFGQRSRVIRQETNACVGTSRRAAPSLSHKNKTAKQRRMNQTNCKRHFNYFATSSSYLHDIGIICCNTNCQIDTLGLEVLLCRHEGRQMRLGTAWSKGTYAE